MSDDYIALAFWSSWKKKKKALMRVVTQTTKIPKPLKLNWNVLKCHLPTTETEWRDEFNKLIYLGFYFLLYIAVWISLSLEINSVWSKSETRNGFIRNHESSEQWQTILPKRHRNATRGPRRQLRAIVGINGCQTVGPPHRRGGSGQGILYRSEAPCKPWIPDRPCLRFPIPSLHPDRLRGCIRPLLRRWRSHRHVLRRRRFFGSLQSQGQIIITHT